MADLTLASVAVDASNAMFARNLPDLVAGEALTAGNAVYIKSDGKIWKSNGTASNAASAFVGIVAKDYAVGRAVTVFGIGARFRYSTGLTPGARYFVSATAGLLADAASTGGTLPVARAVTATDIEIISLTSGAF